MNRLVSLAVGPLGPLVRFDQSPASFLLCPSRGGAPTINAGERRLPTRFRGQGWIRQSRAVLPLVARQVGTKGVASGELRGGGGFGRIWGFRLRWFPSEFEALGGSARSRGVR